MRLLKETCEYRVDSENEAKEVMEQFRSEAAANGYTLTSCGYTKKEKTQKGEVIDYGFHIKVVKTYSSFWE